MREISPKMSYCLKYVNEVLKMFVKTSCNWLVLFLKTRPKRLSGPAALCGLILTGPLNTFSRSYSTDLQTLGEVFVSVRDFLPQNVHRNYSWSGREFWKYIWEDMAFHHNDVKTLPRGADLPNLCQVAVLVSLFIWPLHFPDPSGQICPCQFI